MTSNNINLELFKNIKPLKSALEKLKISTGKEAYKMVIGKKSDFAHDSKETARFVSPLKKDEGLVLDNQFLL